MNTKILSPCILWQRFNFSFLKKQAHRKPCKVTTKNDLCMDVTFHENFRNLVQACSVGYLGSGNIKLFRLIGRVWWVISLYSEIIP